MCWGVPAVVVEVDENGHTARVDYGDGLLREVIIGIESERVRKGDVVIVHAGVIVSKMTREGVLEQINFLKEVLGEEADEASLVKTYQAVLELAERLSSSY
ncbi:MAG: HypC/HybG/HupF family hydrogenase formation chaperone [Thermofilum sp.]|jgi:hydrogenase expression/formation protein HypC|nr:HypC/HybG/HupF family hydrogenase formation chaperone [Thermofilum sp.]MCC6059671.1 HypC/HybG/HupF family hydrogenase formation chaperone [Thermofilum sp.]